MRRGRGGGRLGRRGAKPARAAAPHLLEIDQQVGKPALDGLQMAEPRMNAKLTIAQSFLGTRPVATLGRGRQFNFNFNQ